MRKLRVFWFEICVDGFCSSFSSSLTVPMCLIHSVKGIILSARLKRFSNSGIDDDESEGMGLSFMQKRSAFKVRTRNKTKANVSS